MNVIQGQEEIYFSQDRFSIGFFKINFSSLLTKLAASKQEAKQTNGGQKNSDTFKLYINPSTAATVGSSSTSALQVKICFLKATFIKPNIDIQLSEIEQKISKLENLIGLNEQQPVILFFSICILFIIFNVYFRLNRNLYQ